MVNAPSNDISARQSSGGLADSQITIESIRWKKPPYGRATLLSDELNNLFNLIKHLNEPDYITLVDHNIELSLVEKLAIMDQMIKIALVTPNIEDIKWSRELPSDTNHKAKLSDELNSIVDKLVDMNNPLKILVDERTTLIDRLNELKSSVDSSQRGKDIESISYNQTPLGHKSNLAEELSWIHFLLAQLGRKQDSLENKLTELTNEIRVLRERTNVTPLIHRFNIVNDSYEVGSTITAIEVSWEANKVMKNGYISIDGNQVADIKDYLGMDFIPSSGSILVPNIKIYENKTIMLELVDDLDTSVSATAELKFKHRVMYGSIPYGNSIDQNQLDRLLKTTPLDSPYGVNLKIHCGNYGDLVPVIAIPHEWGIADYQLMINNGKWIHQSLEYTNHTGYKSPYDIYVLDKPLVGIVIITVLKTI